MKTFSVSEVNLYLKSISDNGYSHHTVRSYAGSIEKLVNHFGIENLGDFSKITKVAFLMFVNEMQIDPNSKKTFLRNIRAFGTWLNDVCGINLKDAFDVRFGKSKFPEVKKKLRPVLSIDEIRKVIAAGRDIQERLMLAMEFHTMMRRAEIASIEIRNIEGCKIKFVGKGGNERYTLLTDELCLMLREYLEVRDTDSPYLFYGTRGTGKNKIVDGVWKPISGESINNRVRSAAKRAGIDPVKAEKFTSHRVRATGITVSNRMRSPLVTQKLVGHSDIKTTMGYDGNTMDMVAENLKTSLW